VTRGEPFVLVVDPVSSGAMYPELLKKGGVDFTTLDTERARVAGLRSQATHGALDFERDFGGSAQALLEWAQGKAVTYVIAAAESGMELCEFLRKNLTDVPSNLGDSRKRWDKEHIFGALAEAGVPSLETVAVTADDDPLALSMLERHGRVVVKPSIGAGSVDVRRVDDLVALRGAVRKIVDSRGFFGDQPKALVQRLFPSPYREYVVDAHSADGHHEVIAVSVYDKHVSATGDFVYDRIRWLPEDEAVVPELVDYSTRVLDALGVRTGPTHMETMMGPNSGPRLIDFGARAHGAGHPAKTKYLTGSSQIHRECRYVAGESEAPSMYHLERHGAIVFFNTVSAVRYNGTVTAKDLNGLPGVVESSVNATRASTHPPTRSLMDAVGLGLAFVTGDSLDELDVRCERVRASFATGLVPCSLQEVAGVSEA
jgi:biotin carboxylase